MVGLALVSPFYAQSPPSDNAADFSGRWRALDRSNVIGEGPFRFLVIKRYRYSPNDKYTLTVAHGTRKSVGRGLVFETTTIETGPYTLARDGDLFVYTDEKMQTNCLRIVVEKVQTAQRQHITIEKTYTNLNDGTYTYYKELKSP
jgi:hypothetical protein